MRKKFATWQKAWVILALSYPLAAQSQPVQIYPSPGQPQSGYESYSSGCFYLKADLGGNITHETILREFFGEDVTGSKVKFDPGYRLGIAAGYDLCQFFAVEGEVGVMANNIKSITGADRVDAVFANVPFLVNAKLQAPKNWKLRPYIGGGVGGSASVLSVDHIDMNDISVHGSDSDVVFAYQGFTGFRIAINEAMGVGFEYRYFRADRPTWKADFASGTGTDRLAFGRAETHAFSLVFDWHF
jgi:opacity protein-like surface antigen